MLSFFEMKMDLSSLSFFGDSRDGRELRIK